MNNLDHVANVHSTESHDPPNDIIRPFSTINRATLPKGSRELNYYFKFGWVFLYPLVWLFTVLLKIKNRRWATDEHYLDHQKEFFGFSKRFQNAIGRDFLKPSDKFHSLRPVVNNYAFSCLDGRPLRMLDVATGCGFQAKALKDAGASKVYGIDIVPERVEEARQLYPDEGINFLVMDAAELRFPADCFDAAVVSFALHDMPTKTKKRVLSELVRVTKPGGNVVICEPRTFSSRPLGFVLGLVGELLDESINIKEYVMDDLNPVLTEHGLEVVEEQNVSTFNLLNIKHCRVKHADVSLTSVPPTWDVQDVYLSKNGAVKASWTTVRPKVKKADPLISRLGIRKIFLETTSYCNFRCDFCPMTISSRKPQHMEYELLTKVIDEIAREGITDTVGFYLLGEPLLYRHIFKAVRYARRNGLKTEITTNGSMLTPERVQRLINTGLDKLTISLQRFGTDAHRSRQSPFSFQVYYRRILEAIRLYNLSDSQTEVVIMFMSNASKRLFEVNLPMNLSWNRTEFQRDLGRIINDLYAATGIEANRLNSQIESAVNKMGGSRAFHFRINDRILLAVKPFLDWGNAFTTKRIYPSRFGFCEMAFTSLSILSNGTVTLCCSDYDGETSMGNVGKDSLTEILLSERSRAIFKGFQHFRLVEPRCQNCFGGTNRLKTALRVLFFTSLFKLIRPGPGRSYKEIYPLAGMPED